MHVIDVSVLISGDPVTAGQQRHHEPAEPEPSPESRPVLHRPRILQQSGRTPDRAQLWWVKLLDTSNLEDHMKLPVF